MPASYSLRQHIDGWTVVVAATGEPAQFRGVPMRNMQQAHAEKLIAMLNRPARAKPEPRLQ